MTRWFMVAFTRSCYLLAVLMVLLLLIEYDPMVLFSTICVVALGVWSQRARHWHDQAMFYKEEADRYSGVNDDP